MTVASPCRNICTLERDRRLCLGCGRTLDEIGRWSRMSEAEKQAVLDRLARQVADAGWSGVQWRDLSGGIVALHRGIKP